MAKPKCFVAFFLVRWVVRACGEGAGSIAGAGPDVPDEYILDCKSE